MKAMRNTKSQNIKRKDDVKIRIRKAAELQADQLFSLFENSPKGYDDEGVEKSIEKFGKNVVSMGKEESLGKKIIESFVNPFTAILIALAGVSFVTDIILPLPGNKEPITVIIIVSMVLISGFMRFVQETRSGNAAKRLSAMVETTTDIQRASGRSELPLSEVVVGDIIYLAAGDMVPADMRIIQAKDLFVSQSALTGESEPLEKLGVAVDKSFNDAITDAPNIVFMGSNVISGSAMGIVIAVGDDTQLGSVAKAISTDGGGTSFEKGVNSVSWVLIRFMLVMVPIVFFMNGFTKGNWMSAFLFSVSVAVGLTPEMLPMIVTTCLAKGAISMSKEKTIIKNLNSIQNFGAMDILCTDKTGTLTQDKVVLEQHLDVTGKEDIRVLKHAYLNSYFQTGLKNLMDLAIIERIDKTAEELEMLRGLEITYEKVDEIPFDFDRRRMSVVVADKTGKTQLITKGAVEEMLSICKFVDYEGEVRPLTDELREKILITVDGLNDDGMRVIAVAQKTNPAPVGAFGVKDEADMLLIGYLAFLDPPKETTSAAIKVLNEHGVEVKILTGDNDRVTRCICRQVGLRVDNLLLGVDVDKMSDEELKVVVENTNVFAKLSPDQKSRIVLLLRENGHTVGYMGDGINDAAAMKVSDVGISVDTAVDIAKESADIILLEKSLMVLERGIIEGRKTYANMIKYIKMTASSNFGNMFSVLCASAFLPFLPMESIHLILLNLIYDVSCTAIPWDNVDEDYLKVPRKWDASSVGSFMIWIGPTSSIFDIITYLFMYFVVCPLMTGGVAYHKIADPAVRASYVAIFQAGWFVQSMWTQTLVIHLIRTAHIPFIKSRASGSLTGITFIGILLLTIIPFTPFGHAIGLAALPAMFFGGLAVIVLAYMVVVTLAKNMYIKRYGELL
jgi:magnesium-translocating P-type ATPase